MGGLKVEIELDEDRAAAVREVIASGQHRTVESVIHEALDQWAAGRWPPIEHREAVRRELARRASGPVIPGFPDIEGMLKRR